MSQSQFARKRFELENDVRESTHYNYEDKAYKDQTTEGRAAKDRPRRKDPNHFQKVEISVVALIKMVMNAQSGGDYEIMGNMISYAKGGTMYIRDSFSLPVEASETKVQTTDES